MLTDEDIRIHFENFKNDHALVGHFEAFAGVARDIADACERRAGRELAATDEVLIAIKRPEGYEDVAPELVAEDFIGVHGNGFEWRVVEQVQSRSEKLRDAAKYSAPTEVVLPELPEWSKRDDIGGLVPSEIRSALVAYAREDIALNRCEDAPHATQEAMQALQVAQEWINHAPHGDNCFVSDHYEGDPGNQCRCGKDSLLAHLELVLEADATQEATRQDERDAARFVWWVSNAPKPPEFMTDFMRGMREQWTVDQWRAATDAAMSSTPGAQS